jgi:hypothetical protein
VGQYRSEEQQRENLRKQGGSAGSTARGENAWLVVILKERQPVPEGAEVLKVRRPLPNSSFFLRSVQIAGYKKL